MSPTTETAAEGHRDQMLAVVEMSRAGSLPSLRVGLLQ